MGHVILRRGALGDVVLVGAITGALTGPVWVRTRAAYHPVVRRMAGVTGAIGWSDPVPPGHRVIDLQRTGLRADRRVRKHSVRRRLRLLGVGPGRPEVVDLYAGAAQVLPRPVPWIRRPDGPRDALVVFPGASTVLKQPPPTLLASVVRSWGGPVVAVGGPGDEAAIASLVGAAPLEVATDATGFSATFEALGRARVAFGGDTGLSHLAAACGIPTVVVAGPTHPDDGFLGRHFAAIVGRQVGCRPCTLHRRTWCWRGDRRCMAIDPARVWEAVKACAGCS